MEITTKYVALDDIKLVYDVYGDGNTPILCFHGNSRSPKDFQFLASPERKIISIHLFLHGESTFSEERMHKNFIQDKHVEKLLEKILKKENVDIFHWVAYSQGGLFTLASFPALAHRVKSLYLLAPDGLNDTSFYSWTQRQWWARQLFKRFTKKPNELLQATRLLNKVKIVDPKIVEFIEVYTENPETLNMAYKTWSSFRELRPNNKVIREVLEKNDINFNLIMGRYDKIIPIKSGEKFLKEVNQKDAMTVIENGHNFFKPETEEELLKLLKFDNLDP